MGGKTMLPEADISIPDSEAGLLFTRNGMGDAEPALQLKLINTN
jgi:hypothetical protein